MLTLPFWLLCDILMGGGGIPPLQIPPAAQYDNTATFYRRRDDKRHQWRVITILYSGKTV